MFLLCTVFALLPGYRSFETGIETSFLIYEKSQDATDKKYLGILIMELSSHACLPTILPKT